MKVTPLTEAIAQIIKNIQVEYQGELVDPSVYSIRKEVSITFDDEAMGLIISGNCPESLYRDFENTVKKHGFKIVDTDGSRLILQTA